MTSRANGNNRTWEVRATRAVNYDVRETSDVLSPHNPTLLIGGRGTSRRFVVVDEVVYASREEQLRAYFEHHGVEARILPVTATEPNKSFELFFSLARELDAFRLNRRTEPIIAIGGGVLTDVVSYVASCYRRGVPCIRVPTTLMGLIDAAIGIKTAVNFDHGKNRIGSFEPPFAAILDRGFLATLPMRHILNGVGEIMKLALIRDAQLFELLEKEGKAAIDDRFQTQGREILRGAIGGMLEELEPNLWEENLERATDFGHTFSPVLEMKDVDGLLHGEAVAIDCAFSVVLSQQRGMITKATSDRALDTMARLGLPLYHPMATPDLFLEGLEERTAHRDGYQRAPMMVDIGKYQFLNDITYEELVSSMRVWEEEAKKRGPTPFTSRAETSRRCCPRRPRPTATAATSRAA
ncbi:MAG: sedoheptulose 7-phosphate cyclase [Archangiaceae bacterium]|nr:sedoheptulose 7-phosphate cyclase [Archangiaceae bacterium]